MITDEQIEKAIDFQCHRRYHVLDEDEETCVLDALLELKTTRQEKRGLIEDAERLAVLIRTFGGAWLADDTGNIITRAIDQHIDLMDKM